MSRATTLFVATDEDLVRIFVAVRRPLEHPITSVKKNPVMHQMVGTASWDPGPEDEEAAISVRPADVPISASIYADRGDALAPPVIEPDSKPARALEETAPIRLRALPHAAVAEITGQEIDALAEVLLGEKRPPARIVETLEGDGVVEALPGEALEPLANLGDDAIEQTVEDWNAAMRLTRRRADASALLVLRTLAKEAVARGGNVFTHLPD